MLLVCRRLPRYLTTGETGETYRTRIFMMLRLTRLRLRAPCLRTCAASIRPNASIGEPLCPASLAQQELR